MSSVSVSQEIGAPPEAVWSIVVAMDSWVDTIEAIEVVERLDDGDRFGLGTQWRETRTMFGKKATEEMEVTEFEEGVRYATFAESHGSKYYSEIRVDPTDAGSRLSMEFRGEAQSGFAKVMDATLMRLFMGATRKALAKGPGRHRCGGRGRHLRDRRRAITTAPGRDRDALESAPATARTALACGSGHCCRAAA